MNDSSQTQMKKIFLLHGWTYSVVKWQPFIQLMSAQGYEVVSLTIPGLTKETDHVWTLDNYVEWLNETLASEAHPIVMGHSNGGRIALAFAAKYPSKFRQLIIVDGAGIYHHEPLLQLKRFVFGVLAKFGKALTTSARLRALLYRVARVHDYEQASPIMRRTMAGLIAIDLTPQLGQIITPTVLIWGANDTVTPVSDGYLMAKRLPRATLHIIDGARHSPHVTHPEQLVNIILSNIAV